MLVGKKARRPHAIRSTPFSIPSHQTPEQKGQRNAVPLYQVKRYVSCPTCHQYVTVSYLVLQGNPLRSDPEDANGKSGRTTPAYIS